VVNKPRLGISTCLLGENVRYDGGHKLDRYLRDTLGPFVEWVPVCPEVECGLPIPRESMHLEGSPDAPRLITRKTRMDYTDQMVQWANKRLAALQKENLCGYVFKSKSPSSGMRDIRIYSEQGQPVTKGSGVFAGLFMKRFPLIPVEDEGRLNDPGLRENFIERVFVNWRWRQFIQKNNTAKGFVDFHTSHKLTLMAHSPSALRDLGRIVAENKGAPPQSTLDAYLESMMTALKRIATVRKNTNVLHHVTGYFKRVLSPDEKQELLEVIGQYYQTQVPLIVPVTLLNHYVRKYDEPYLKQQMYLNPHPIELMLRNHV
jgi:uncharacterized protein YbgA (DUF1722 family)/uncharacterized protein YbbK (DUF523 family)